MRTILDVPYLPTLTSSPATRQARDLYAPDTGTNLPVDMTHEATTANLGREDDPITAALYRFIAEPNP